MAQDWFSQFEAQDEGEGDWFAQFAAADTGPAEGIRPMERGMVDRALDLVPNRERLSQGVPGILAGVAKEGLNVAAQGGDLLRAGWNIVAPDSLDMERPYQAAGPMQADNPWQQLGQRGVQAAGAVQAMRAVPGILGISKTRAAGNLTAATEAAKDVAVNVEGPGQAALRLSELAERGGSMPRAAQQFLRRVTDPAKGDLTFEEARDFYSNLSRLSANEFGRLNPTMQRQVAAMKGALNDALVEAANTVGKGQQYTAGVREYARAARAAELGTKAAKVGGGVIGADFLLRRLGAAMQ